MCGNLNFFRIAKIAMRMSDNRTGETIINNCTCEIITFINGGKPIKITPFYIISIIISIIHELISRKRIFQS